MGNDQNGWCDAEELETEMLHLWNRRSGSLLMDSHARIAHSRGLIADSQRRIR